MCNGSERSLLPHKGADGQSARQLGRDRVRVRGPASAATSSALAAAHRASEGRHWQHEKDAREFPAADSGPPPSCSRGSEPILVHVRTVVVSVDWRSERGDRQAAAMSARRARRSRRRQERARAGRNSCVRSASVQRMLRTRSLAAGSSATRRSRRCEALLVSSSLCRSTHFRSQCRAAPPAYRAKR